MGYCDECRLKKETRFKERELECEYEEIHMFFEWINYDLKTQFELSDCPDKNPETKLKYTCDLVFEEKNTSEKIYVEVKTVPYGFDNKEDGQKGKSHNITIAQDSDQRICAELVSGVIDCCDESKMNNLWKFMVTIPQLQIGEKECAEFCGKLKEFLDETSFEEEEYCFIYNRTRQGKGTEIRIPFTRKNDKLRKMFKKNVGFQYNISGDGHLTAIKNRLTDVDKLIELLKQNAQHTSDKKKFPDTEGRKILLNVLRLPQGLNFFFDLNLKTVFGWLMEDLDRYNSTAYESYLLYHSPEYCDMNVKEDGSYENKPIGDTLFIVPLIKGIENEIICWCKADN